MIAVILAYFSAVLGVAVAIAGTLRERRSVAHWFFVAGMAALSAEGIFSGLTADGLLPEELIYWQNWRLVALSFLPGTWLLFSLSYARGNFREFLRKWRFAVTLAFLAPVGLAVGFHAKLISSASQTEAGKDWILGLSATGMALQLMFLVSGVIVLMNLERTFRASIGTMRWRIKFMILGLGVLFAVRLYASSQALLFRGMTLSMGALESSALLVACLLILRSLSRSGAAEVGVYPSQAVLHSSLTLSLAGIYLLIVGVFAKVVVFLGGDDAFQIKAFLVLVALVLLAALLLSDRVRLQLNQFVSRHFRRSQHDYRVVWRTFTERTTRRLERADLCRAVVKLTSDVFQALSVTVWLIDDQNQSLIFAASTSISESSGKNLNAQVGDFNALTTALMGHPDPTDIDSSQAGWAVALRAWQPVEFPEGGHRICVPMMSSGELFGVMILGDRVGGVPFTVQDFDLLKCVSDQAAAGLLSVALSQRLLRAKELEAFQTMSAFFVHDLKNTSSTLSLMLQNLPAHFNDPAFREDALRGISKAVNHVNDLIRRLTLVRQELQINPVEADLGEVVARVLGELGPAMPVKLTRELRPLPKQLLDPNQIHKVVTNLVLNAREAVTTSGEIRVETEQWNGWTVLTVTDNGCGMSREFLNRSLFRPFQTTKKEGIGIGMFQSKMIVEAHHGKIEVESEPGQGTTFRVLLPLGKEFK